MSKNVRGAHNSFLVNRFVSRYSDAVEPYVEASKLAEFKEMNSEIQSLLQGEGDLAQGLAVAINHLEHIPRAPNK